MVFSDEDKILKKFVFEMVHSKEVDAGASTQGGMVRDAPWRKLGGML